MKKYIILLITLIVLFFWSVKVFGAIDTKVVPKNCSVWYDWCNTCSVEKWKIKMCTQKACLVQKTPKCLKYKKKVCSLVYSPVCWEKDGVEKTYENKCFLEKSGAKFLYNWKCKVIPKNCSVWYDWCNTCSVEKWKIKICTQKACLVQKAPKCLKYEKKECPLNMPNPISLCWVGWKVIVTERDENGCAIKYWCEKPSICSLVYSPVCWEKDGVEKTYENKCFLEKSGAKFLYNWKCKVVPKNCSVWYDWCNTCSVEKWKIKMCTQKFCLVQKAPKCLKYTDYNLFEKVIKKIDNIFEKFTKKLDNKYDDVTKKREILNKILLKINNLKSKKPSSISILNYLWDKVMWEINKLK